MMKREARAVVLLEHGVRGDADRKILERGDGIVEVRLDDGRLLEAPASAFVLRDDGSYELPIEIADAEATEAGEAVGAAVGRRVIPVVAEEAVVSKRTVETGRVRVHKTVRERVEPVDETLWREEVEVRRVAVDRPLEGPAEVRHEGDTMIIPVVEEVLVVSKRLRVKEELHVTRRRVEHRAHQDVSLRVEEATVERNGDPLPGA